MDMDILLARVKRSRLDEVAGDNYRDQTSEIVKQLNKKKAGAIIGIQSDKGPYTVIAEAGLLIRNNIGEETKLDFDEVLPLLTKNAMQVGKGGNFEFIEFGKNGFIWMKDGPTMCAIWNICMLLQKQQKL